MSVLNYNKVMSYKEKTIEIIKNYTLLEMYELYTKGLLTIEIMRQYKQIEK